MVIMMMSETKRGETPCDVSPSAVSDDDEEDHDGWGPVRPRRSSMPAPLSADAPSEHSERDECIKAPAINHKSPLET
jgi:hypothetical protein